MGPTGRRVRLTASVVVLVTALNGCSDNGDGGGDDDGAEAGAPPSASGSTTVPDRDAPCAQRFNADAPIDFPRLIRLSHGVGAAILTGTYAGKEFTAQTYGTDADEAGTEQQVRPGACVVTEQSDTGAALYVFAVGSDDAWHWFVESDPGVPLSIDPASQLDAVVPVTLDDGRKAPRLVTGRA